MARTGSMPISCHSFHMIPADPARVLAVSDYGGAITAMIGRDNMVGTQFHPEKSQALGLRLLENFLRWRPLTVTLPGALGAMIS